MYHANNKRIDLHKLANFGRNDIRAFPQQASALKELTAHDWECLLKVCITAIVSSHHYFRPKWFSSSVFIPMIEGLLNPAMEKINIPLILKLSIVYNIAYLDQQTETTIRLVDRELENLVV